MLVAMLVAAFVAALAAAAHAGMAKATASRGGDPGSVAVHVREAATRYRVPEPLIVALIRVESDFNPRAVSPRGALGLMQLMPTTAALYGARNALDPAQNIAAGARYLRELLDRFSDDIPLVLAAYNAGEVAVIRYGGVPPFPETRAFVAQVLSLIVRASGGAASRDVTEAESTDSRGEAGTPILP